MLKSKHFIFFIAGFILIRTLLFIGLEKTKFDFMTGDASDYYVTAENLVSGNGFISNEYNPDNRRDYLGDNYYFAAEPLYPLYIAAFLYFGLSSPMIVFLSNMLLYIIILLITWKVLSLLNINKVLALIALLLLILNTHFEFFSFQMLAVLLRITLLFMFFMALLAWKENPSMLWLLYLGLLSGLLILVRITYLFIPFLVIPVIIKAGKTKKLFTSMIYILIISLVVAPWIYRNYKNFNMLTIDVRLHQKIFYGSIYDVPDGIDLKRYELAKGISRITDNNRYKLLINEKDPQRVSVYLADIENTPIQWLRLFALRLWELFKPFPTGGPFNKLILQVFSAILYIPWAVGLVLFFLGTIIRFRSLYFWFGLSLLSFIGFQLLQNSPHSRYMLPLVPIGYISFVAFISQKLKGNLN